MVGYALIRLRSKIAIRVEFGVDTLLSEIVDELTVWGAFFIDFIWVNGNSFFCTDGVLKMASDVGFTASRYTSNHNENGERYGGRVIW